MTERPYKMVESCRFKRAQGPQLDWGASARSVHMEPIGSVADARAALYRTGLSQSRGHAGAQGSVGRAPTSVGDQLASPGDGTMGPSP
jgi:hypothetical protein